MLFPSEMTEEDGTLLEWRGEYNKNNRWVKGTVKLCMFINLPHYESVCHILKYIATDACTQPKLYIAPQCSLLLLTSEFLRAMNAPENASLHTLQYMGRACDVEYQRWFPDRKSWWSPAWKERDGNTAAILWLLTNLLSSAEVHLYRLQ
jgi:hypothetical protein